MPGLADGELGRCVCDSGFFGRTCRETVCDAENAAPPLPTWTLVRKLQLPKSHNVEGADQAAPSLDWEIIVLLISGVNGSLRPCKFECSGLEATSGAL